MSTCRASGSLWFIGELVNVGAADVDTLQVSVGLLDGGGSTLTSGAADVIGVTILGPRARTVWQARIASPPPAWQQVRIVVQAGPVPEDIRRASATDVAAEVSAVATSPSPGGQFSVSGRVTNPGTTAAGSLVVTAGVYDANGVLIAVGETRLQTQSLPPGGSAPFTIGFPATATPPARAVAYVKGMKSP